MILKISENIFKIHQNKKKSKKSNKYFHRNRKFFSGKIGLVVFLIPLEDIMPLFSNR